MPKVAMAIAVTSGLLSQSAAVRYTRLAFDTCDMNMYASYGLTRCLSPGVLGPVNEPLGYLLAQNCCSAGLATYSRCMRLGLGPGKSMHSVHRLKHRA